MASCHKCGKVKIRKRRDGSRSCKRCGIIPSITQVGRSGELRLPTEQNAVPKQGELITSESRGTAVAEAGATPVSILDLLDRALSDKSVDVEKMSKLMDLYERVEKRNASQAYTVAMVEAQKEMDPIRTDASNPQTKSKYATYPALDRAIRPIYSKHGFAVSYDTGNDAPPDFLRVIAHVMHNGGHTQDYHIDMPADGKGARGGDVMTKTHATGSAFTYGKRYVLGGIFNIVISDRTDDDGNSAGVKEFITAEQAENIKSLIDFTKSDTGKFCKYFKIASIAELPAKDHDRAIESLKAQPQVKK